MGRLLTFRLQSSHYNYGGKKKFTFCICFSGIALLLLLTKRISEVKGTMKVDVYTAAVPREMDGMNDTHTRAFVNSCLPPPPR